MLKMKRNHLHCSTPVFFMVSVWSALISHQVCVCVCVHASVCGSGFQEVTKRFDERFLLSSLINIWPLFSVTMLFKEEDPFSSGICGSHPSLIRTMCDMLKWCSCVQVLSAWKHHHPHSPRAQDTRGITDKIAKPSHSAPFHIRSWSEARPRHVLATVYFTLLYGPECVEQSS